MRNCCEGQVSSFLPGFSSLPPLPRHRARQHLQAPVRRRPREQRLFPWSQSVTGGTAVMGLGFTKRVGNVEKGAGLLGKLKSSQKGVDFRRKPFCWDTVVTSDSKTGRGPQSPVHSEGTGTTRSRLRDQPGRPDRQLMSFSSACRKALNLSCFGETELPMP